MKHSFSRMRLIPDYIYKRLDLGNLSDESKRFTVNFGAETTKPSSMEEQVRLANQETVQQTTSHVEPPAKRPRTEEQEGEQDQEEKEIQDVDKTVKPVAAAGSSASRPAREALQDVAHDRSKMRKYLASLFREYFVEDLKGNRLLLADGSETVLKGADLDSLVNFLVPRSNSHPSKAPSGFAAVVDILRENDIYEAGLYPNLAVGDLFKTLYKQKPTAYTKKIVAHHLLLRQARQLASAVSKDGGDASMDWQAFR